MNIAKPLFWHQGISFRSMHLQHLDRANQSLPVPFQKYMTPYFWGVWSMEIDEGALKTGTFTLLKGDFVFPEGAHASLQGNSRINARSFLEQWEKDGKPLNIYRGPKSWTDDGANVTVLPSLANVSSVQTRFAAMNDPEEARDLHAFRIMTTRPSGIVFPRRRT